MLNFVLLLSTAQAGSISTAGITAGPDGGAATPNTAAVIFNPAAIAAVPGFTAMMDVQASAVRIEATATRNGGIDPATGEPFQPANASVVVPNAVIGVTWQAIEDRLTLGAAVNNPFTGGGNYTANENNPPPYTGHQRYHIIETTILTIAATGAVGVTVVDGLHLGGSVSYVRDSLDVLQASDPLGTEGLPPGEFAAGDPQNPYSYDTYLSGNTTGSHIGWMGGVYFDKFDKLQVGASYSGPAQFQVDGEGAVDVPEALGVDGPVSVPADLTISFPLPAIARLYANSQLTDKWMVGAGVDWQLWNNCCGDPDGDIDIFVTNRDGEGIGSEDGVQFNINPQQYNPRRVWNSMNFSVYGGNQVSEKLWLGGRVGYNQYAVPTYAITPSNLDFENIPLMAAARYTVGGFTVGLAYSKFILFSREVTDSAWNLQDGNARFSPELPYKTNANGTYSGAVDGLGLRLAWSM